MGGILECDGVFQVLLVDGWGVSGEAGKQYDISHESLDVGVNISVFERAVFGDDIVKPVYMFIKTVGADPTQVPIRPLASEKDHSRAFARFEEGERTWIVASMFVGDAAVVASSNSGLGDAAAFAAGEMVVASLGPVTRRRRFGRR